MGAYKYYNPSTQQWEIVKSKSIIKPDGSLEYTPDDIKNIDDKVGGLENDFNVHQADNTPHREATTVERSGKDSEGIYVILDYKRADGTLFKKSTLSGGTSPEYTTRTVDFYDTDGVTIAQTVTYSLTYDDGDLISEVIQ